MEEEGNDKNLRPEDIVSDEGARYESEEEIIEQKSKVKPVGPALDLEIPLRPPPGYPDKGILQSQGRLLWKMRFMPSSLTSKSHRLLTALVDSQHKKVYKVKNCITDIDPEKEKEEREKAEEQSIRAQRILQQKREKMDQKNALRVDRGRRAPHTFLEDALEEDDEYDNHYESHRASSRRRFEEDMEVESKSERRLINAKRTPSKYSESEREESEYESESEEGERLPSRMEEPEHDEEEDEEQEAEEAGGADAETEDDEEEPRQKSRGRLNRKEMESDGESPPRKVSTHRRMAVVFDSDED
ncbi:hypothetical protein QJS04_geneDACA005158 [Acorus gramineus]|uniref:RNA polymerase-associated protein LEO1 n=1 Tax=Acorus gramineus TaxID=55184 RepID=A0AAV9AW66_ACOGR|nr:hypothetical protein QJS04_geneDACA005158 [Acorus gramineus]